MREILCRKKPEKRRGAAQRMNTGVSIENSGFVKALAGATSTTTGDEINSILTRYSTDNPDLPEQTDKFPAMVKDKLPGIAWKGGDTR